MISAEPSYVLHAIRDQSGWASTRWVWGDIARARLQAYANTRKWLCDVQIADYATNEVVETVRFVPAGEMSHV